MGKCLKDVREATLRADPWGLLGDPHDRNEDIKDAKIGNVSERRNSLASDRGHIKRRTISRASGHGQFEERDQKVEQLRKLVRDLELEARGRHQRRDRDNREIRDGSVENQCRGGIQPI